MSNTDQQQHTEFDAWRKALAEHVANGSEGPMPHVPIEAISEAVRGEHKLDETESLALLDALVTARKQAEHEQQQANEQRKRADEAERDVTRLGHRPRGLFGYWPAGAIARRMDDYLQGASVVLDGTRYVGGKKRNHGPTPLPRDQWRQRVQGVVAGLQAVLDIEQRATALDQDHRRASRLWNGGAEFTDWKREPAKGGAS